MFTFTAEKVTDGEEVSCDFQLHYADDSVTLELSPEKHSPIVITDRGSFDSCPGNGDFTFSWNRDHFSFTVGKYGDGNGGTLIVTVKNTPELHRTFVTALEQWNAHV